MASLVTPGALPAMENVVPDTVRGYVNREERRDTGVKHQLTEWLTAAGLIEFESVVQRQYPTETSARGSDDESATLLQVSLGLAPVSWATAELIYEYDTAADEHRLDEALIAAEMDDLEMELGKLYVPFGEYFSHFVTGPLLEFGETRATGMTVSYATAGRLDLTGFVYQGEAQGADSGGDGVDGGFSIEGSPTPIITLGASYLSDLAAGDGTLASAGSTSSQRRVAGLGAYAVASHGRIELTSEWLQAAQAFRGVDPDRDRPRAWNIELAYAMARNFAWAVRLEGSRELESAPQTQVGTAIAWRIAKQASITLEYLQGSYKAGIAEDAQGRELDRTRQAGMQVSIEF